MGILTYLVSAGVHKAQVFRFKRGNWENLRNEISSADWRSILDNTEPDVSWKNFFTSVMSLIENNIPKINVKSEFCPPWFDAECHSQCKEKDRLRKKYKHTKNLADGLKFSNCRKEFKDLMKRRRETTFVVQTTTMPLVSGSGDM